MREQEINPPSFYEKDVEVFNKCEVCDKETETFEWKNYKRICEKCADLIMNEHN